MLPDTSENICVLEKQLRAVFLLAERSPEGKLPFVRYQQFSQIGDDLFMRLLRIEPSATAQHRDKVGFDTLLGHRGDLLKMESVWNVVGANGAIKHDALFQHGFLRFVKQSILHHCMYVIEVAGSCAVKKCNDL